MDKPVTPSVIAHTERIGFAVFLLSFSIFFLSIPSSIARD